MMSGRSDARQNSRARSLAGLGVLALTLVGLSGCWKQPGTQGLPCTADSECDEGQRCLDGACNDPNAATDAMTTATSSGGPGSSTTGVDGSTVTTDAVSSEASTTGEPGTTSATTGEPGACGELDCAPDPDWSVAFGDGEILNVALAVDGAGNIYVGGIFKLGITLPQEMIPGAATVFKMYVMKFDTEGALAWISDLGDGMGGDEMLRDLIVTAGGAVYITGDYTAPLQLCGEQLQGGSMDPDLFVAALDADTGICGDIVSFPTVGVQFGSGLAYDATFDRLILAGGYQGQLELGAGALEAEGFGDGQYTGFIAGLDSSLTVHWAQQVGGLGGYEVVNTVTNGPPGSVLLSGSFESSITVGGAEHTNLGGARDAYVARLTVADGVFGWSDSFASEGRTRIGGLAYDGGDTMVVVGNFTGTIPALQLDSGSETNHDIFMVSMDATTGDVNWRQRFGAPESDDIVRGVTVDTAHAHAFVSGPCLDGLDLGGGPLAVSGSDDACLARYELETGAHLWSAAFGGDDTKLSESGRRLAFDASGDPVALLWTGDFAKTIELAGPPLNADGEHTRSFLARLLP